MDIQEIEVDIDKNGNVKIHVSGAPGSACLDLSADLESALGHVVGREMSPEAYDEQQVRVERQRHLGQGW